MSMIDEIKTALGDPSCESVDVSLVAYPAQNIQNLTDCDELIYWTELGRHKIKSYAVNHVTYPDIEGGDKVSTPKGVGVIIDTGFGYDLFCEGNEYLSTFQRDKLVLLAKGETQ